ncbi:hypothetical protein H4582DRAFT_1592311 [Lactarius indigo]|nr:hypothetical protein H4582DRAFT_1592311 [Lactarius indigo]
MGRVPVSPVCPPLLFSFSSLTVLPPCRLCRETRYPGVQFVDRPLQVSRKNYWSWLPESSARVLRYQSQSQRGYEPPMTVRAADASTVSERVCMRYCTVISYSSYRDMAQCAIVEYMKHAIECRLCRAFVLLSPRYYSFFFEPRHSNAHTSLPSWIMDAPTTPLNTYAI